MDFKEDYLKKLRDIEEKYAIPCKVLPLEIHNASDHWM